MDREIEIMKSIKDLADLIEGILTTLTSQIEINTLLKKRIENLETEIDRMKEA